MEKRIAQIFYATEKEIGDGFKVRQPFPNKEFHFANPFILLHHMGPKEILPFQKVRVNPHPHRGFSPVTIQLQGEGYHKDNAGNAHIIKAGDVQWMFAGRGIMHSEGPSEDMVARGGIFELIQLWINVPCAYKAKPPFYQYIRNADMPELSGEAGVSLKLICGAYNNVTAPVKSFSPVTIVKGELSSSKKVQLYSRSGDWALLYIAKGVVEIESELIRNNNLVLFDTEEGVFSFTAKEESTVLFLAAAPIEEPVAAKDNFVMNTMEEVEQAIADYRNGVFGNLEF